MNQSSPKPMVRGGIPWWLWGMIIFGTAIVALATVVALWPQDSEALYQTAIDSFDEGDSETFKASLASLRNDADYADHVIFLEGLDAAKEGKDLRALELFESVKDNDALKPLVLQNIGRSFTATGQYKKAIEAFDASIALDSENADETRIMVAQLYYGIGGLKHAESLLNTVIESATDKPTMAYSLRAKIRAEMFSYADAVEDYALLLETPGDRAAASPALIADYVRALLKVGDEARIQEAATEMAADLMDQQLQWQLNMAAGNREQVLDAIAATKGSPNSPGPTDKIEAQAALEVGRYEAAAKMIRTAIGNRPRDIDTFELAAKIFEAAGMADEQKNAEQNIEKLRQLQQDYLATLTEIGDDIKSADLRLKLAEILVELAQFQEANRWYSVAAMIDPERREEATAALEELRQLRSLPPVLVPFEEEK
ncbi:tetratricopeptide repeat protein [Fuerstiella marisgermanici]|nr:tetratricopeptide repeat protein [Fuerstiella marisgermanici]